MKGRVIKLLQKVNQGVAFADEALEELEQIALEQLLQDKPMSTTFYQHAIESRTKLLAVAISTGVLLLIDEGESRS